jgi:universal stress protein family protein
VASTGWLGCGREKPAQRGAEHSIVLAAHGRGGLSRAALGSVAMEVLTTAATPLMVVPPAARIRMRRQASAALIPANYS